MKNITDFLQQISSQAEASVSEGSIQVSPLAPAKIFELLKQFLGDQAHIIDPALSLRASPLLDGPSQGLAAFAHLQAIRKLCLMPDEKIAFTKPIVMVIATPAVVNTQESKGADSKAQGQKVVVKWKTIVILPLGYSTPQGTQLNNPHPLFFYFDPEIFQPNQIPKLVGALGLALHHGCLIPTVIEGRQATIRLEGMFPKPMFFNGSRPFCDNVNTSAWWAIYFALMAVGTGRHDFDSLFTDKKPTLHRVQQLLQKETVVPRVEVLPLALSTPKSSVSSSSTTTSSHSEIALSTSFPEENVLASEKEVKTVQAAVTKDMNVASSANPVTSSSHTLSRLEDTQSSVPVKMTNKQASKSSSSESKFESKESAEGLGEEVKQIPALPAYSPAVQTAILRAYGLSQNLETKLSRDSTGHFDVYFYTHQSWQEDLLLKDSAEYWRAKQGNIQNRRVAFLLQTSSENLRPIAVLIQLTAQPSSSSSTLWESFSQATTQQILATAEWARAAKTWYSGLQITLLGANKDHGATKSLLKNLQKSITKAYQITGNIRIDCIDIPESLDANVVLTHGVLTMLSLARTEDKSAVIADREHRELFLSVLKNKMANFALQNPTLYLTLTENFRQLTKFNLLIEQRKTNYGLTGDTIETFLALKTRDRQVKEFIYTQVQGEVVAMLKQFSWEKLVEFLGANDMSGWLSLLSQEKQNARAKILAWEQGLEEKIEAGRIKKDYCSAFTDKAKAAALFIYRCSWLGIGKELIEGLARVGAADEKSTGAISEVSRQAAERMGELVTLFTQSDRLAARSSARTAEFLGDYPLSRSLGLGMGLGLQILLGPLDLIRLAAVMGGTQFIAQWIQSRQINEEKAVVAVAPLSPQAVLRTIQALSSVLEAYAAGYAYPLIFAVGGIGGSIAVTTLAKIAVPSLGNTSIEGREKRQSVLFLIALAGGQLGQFSFKAMYLLVNNIQNRLMHREVAFRLFSQMAQQSQLQSLRVDGPPFRYSPSLWFNNRNPIEVEWTTRDGVQQITQCEVTSLPALTPQGIVGLVCESTPTELASAMSLPSP